MTSRVGGVVLMLGADSLFVPTASAVRLLAIPRCSPVPGAARDLLGVALVDGEVLPVLAIGDARRTMLVCTWLGERLGLVGHEDATTGTFDVDDATSGVRVSREDVGVIVAKSLDLAAVYARARQATWAARAPSAV